MASQEVKLGTGKLLDLTIKNNTGDFSLDIRDNYSELSYYESILNSSASILVVMNDAVGLKSALPIVGGETISYKFTDTYDTVDIDIGSPMRVYKISDRSKENNVEVYGLFCTTEHMMKSKYKEVNRTFSNMKYSDMVENILREYFNSELFSKDETQGLHRHTFPRISPFAAIRQIAEEAECADGDRASSSYFFWQNNDGYQFRHLESLLSQPSFRKYYYFQGEVPSDYKFEGARILQMNENVSFDLLGGVNEGQYGMNVKYYDPISKTLFNSKYSYFDSFSQTEHNGYPTLTEKISKEFSENYSLEKYITTNQVSSKIPYVSERDSYLRTQFRRRQNFVGRSTSINSRIRNNSISVMVYGDSRISAGLTIDIEIPNAGQKKSSSSEIIDRFTSGKYLVTSVKHRLTRTEYYTVMTLSKESYLKKPEIGSEI